jgi:hypothetical protein
VKRWRREDGLGTTSAVQFLDMPADQPAVVESFLEKTRAEVNPIRLAFLRWQLQVQLFKVIRSGGGVTTVGGCVAAMEACH